MRKSKSCSFTYSKTFKTSLVENWSNGIQTQWISRLIQVLSLRVDVVPQERKGIVNPNGEKKRVIPQKNLQDSPIP